MKSTRLKIRISMQLITMMVLSTGIVLNSCENTDNNDDIFRTNEGLTIGEYVQQHGDTLSEFYKVLQKINRVSFLKAYGEYTCFIPTNEAFFAYYDAIGKQSLDDFTTAGDSLQLKQIVAFHICADSIGTSDFVNGGLPDTTMSGDYLTTRFLEGGLNNIRVNDKATILKRDISCENGIIHIIDAVLDPIVLTLAQTIENNADFSILTEALKETGLYDSLNILSRKMTMFATSDSVFNLNGINNYNDLLLKYSNTGDPYLNREDTLYIWLAYQCIENNRFLTDFESRTYNNLTHEIIFSIDKGLEFLVNKTSVNVALSNRVAKNGTYHELNGLLGFVPIPVAVYFEVTDYPDLWALTDIFRKTRVDVGPGQPLENVAGIRTSNDTKWEYRTASTYYHKDYFQYWYDDAGGFLWFEFETPELVTDAEYNIWICGKNVTNDRGAAEVYFDDVLIGHVDMGTQYTGTPDELLAQGYKIYTDPGNSQNLGYLINSVTITTKGTHRVKLVKWDPGNPDRQRWVMTIDMIHFIPVDKNQIDVVFKRG